MSLTHDEILKSWDEDSNIDMNDLSKSSVEIPKLHSKYLRMLIDCKTRKISIGHKIESLKKDLALYYSGQATPEFIKKKGPFQTKLKTQAAINQHVETDPDLISKRDRIEYIDVMIEALNYILKEISQRNFVIKNMLEFEKLRNGGF